MTQDDINLKLGALADGELDPAERAALEARIVGDAALVRTLAAIRVLNAAARNEKLPDSCARPEKIWPLVTQRNLSFPAVFAQKLQSLARAEACPVLSSSRSAAAWRNIHGRTLHAFHEDHFEKTVPEIPRESWDQAWKFISTRTRLAAINSAPQKPVHNSPSTVHRSPPIFHRLPSTSWNKWSWGVGLGLAAAAMLAIVFSTPENPRPPDPPSLTNSMAMSIPESQDERYGVLVKYVPGNNDPIICLFEKQLDLNAK